ncbi:MULTISPECIES: hypothetical protein [unclassified Pseudomonas]|uniref:hypothetical protein n=1 Tax=unclassified Pseudomonas TaxID=196821 RepID=UPI000CD19C1B|nr:MULTISPECIES: hypothetical protein [unclassified Pseudomonas]POA31816.1 hypothetical protein C1887_11725 [Pseudomonas sp. GW456-R21]POA68547.1 hypothetical protein C1884_09370 [Pseudomonas sp. GW460-R15]
MPPLTKRRVLLTAIALLVMVPPTMAAAFFGVMGLMVSIPSLLQGDFSAPLTLPMVVFGWLGVYSGWRIYFGLLRSRPRFGSKVRLMVGLLCGMLAAAVMIFGVHPLSVSIALFAPSIIVAAILAVLMWSIPAENHRS